MDDELWGRVLERAGSRGGSEFVRGALEAALGGAPVSVAPVRGVEPLGVQKLSGEAVRCRRCSWVGFGSAECPEHPGMTSTLRS